MSVLVPFHSSNPIQKGYANHRNIFRLSTCVSAYVPFLWFILLPSLHPHDVDVRFPKVSFYDCLVTFDTLTLSSLRRNFGGFLGLDDCITNI